MGIYAERIYPRILDPWELDEQSAGAPLIGRHRHGSAESRSLLMARFTFDEDH